MWIDAANVIEESSSITATWLIFFVNFISYSVFLVLSMKRIIIKGLIFRTRHNI